MRGASLPFAYVYLLLRLETAMSDKPSWLDGPTEADFYRGITDKAPGAKESAMTLAAVGLGYMYGLKKAKKKKKNK